MTPDFWSSYFQIPKRSYAEITADATSHVVRIDRNYESCVCGARDEYGCRALGQTGCCCLAPMMIVESNDDRR